MSLPRVHPVDIAAQRVDLTVVRQETVRMGALPARKGVGRKPLVHQRERGLYLRVAKVGIKLRNLGRDQQSFVNDGRGREATEVEQLTFFKRHRSARTGCRLADHVELALQRLRVRDSLAAADKYLAHRRQPSRAMSPQALSTTGTVRHPSSRCPSSRTTRSTSLGTPCAAPDRAAGKPGRPRTRPAPAA